MAIFSDGRFKVVVTGARGGITAEAESALDEISALAGDAIDARDDVVNAFADRGVAVGETSEDDIAMAFMFGDGKRSWVEVSRETGGPTSVAAQLIAEGFDVSSLTAPALSALYVALGIPSPADLGVSQGALPTLSTFVGPLGFNRGVPRLAVPDEWEVFGVADTSAVSVYWPYTVVMEDGRFAKFFSTDHSSAHADSGIFLAIAGSLTSGAADWTQKGRVHRYDGGGTQTETPSVIYNPVLGQWLLYYQQTAFPGGVGDQQTAVAQAPAILDASDNPVAWTGDQNAVRGVTTLSRSVSHTGYFHACRIDGRWIGYSILGSSEDGAGFAFWESADGLIYDYKARLGYCEHLVTDVTGWEEGYIVRLNQGVIVLFGGRPWWIGPVGIGGSGGSIGSLNRLVAMPVDIENFTLGRAVDITPVSYPAGVTDIDSVTGAFEWTDSEGSKRLFLDCRADGPTGRFIHLEVL